MACLRVSKTQTTKGDRLRHETGLQHYTGRLVRVLFLGVLAVCALAQSPIERAVTLAREKNYAEARKALQGVDPPSEASQRIAFHRLKAAIASGLGQGAAAAQEMLSALALAPSDPGLLLAAAAAETQAGDLDAALEHARRAGATAQAHALIGDIQEKRGAYVEAAKAYQAAAALAPENEQYRIALALELVQHHTFEPAIAVLKQAAPLFPKSAKVRTLLGIAQYAGGHAEDAMASLTGAVALDPTLEQARTYLARIVLEANGAPPQRTVDALCGGDATVCAAVNSRVAHERGDAALQAESILTLQHAAPDSAIARCELARAYEWSGQWQDARAQMEECVRLDPSPQSHYRLGRIYGRLGLADLARKQMEMRNAAARQMSDEVARRESAVEAFQYAVK